MWLQLFTNAWLIFHVSSPTVAATTLHPTIPLQEDNFVATMTVNETMSFYADIILPKTFDKFERKARVAEVLSAMGLKHKAKTMVGGTLPGGLMLRGLSGGERKRLSIAAGERVWELSIISKAVCRESSILHEEKDLSRRFHIHPVAHHHQHCAPSAPLAATSSI